MIEDLADVLARVDHAGPPAWLIEGIWPRDAYGVFAAEDKAGKTWAILDLAELATLGLVRLCFRVPTLTSGEDLTTIERELAARPAALVVIDPLYLAVGAGATGANLYAMGAVLSAIQGVCQHAGAALVVITHWNKTGEGTGASRISGVGPGAWGRVLASAGVAHRASDPTPRRPRWCWAWR